MNMPGDIPLWDWYFFWIGLALMSASIVGCYQSYQSMWLTEGRIAVRKLIANRFEAPFADFHERLLAKNLVDYLSGVSEFDGSNITEYFVDFISDPKFEQRLESQLELVLAEYMVTQEVTSTKEEFLHRLKGLAPINIDSAKVRSAIYDIMDSPLGSSPEILSAREIRAVEKLVSQKKRTKKEFADKLVSDKSTRFSAMIPNIAESVVNMYFEKPFDPNDIRSGYTI